MTPAETLASFNEKSLEVLASVQESVLDAYKGAVSALPLDSLPEAPALLPFGPGDVVDLLRETYDFRAKVLEADKAFTLGLIDPFAPKPSPATAKAAKAAK